MNTSPIRGALASKMAATLELEPEPEPEHELGPDPDGDNAVTGDIYAADGEGWMSRMSTDHDRYNSSLSLEPDETDQLFTFRLPEAETDETGKLVTHGQRQQPARCRCCRSPPVAALLALLVVGAVLALVVSTTIPEAHGANAAPTSPLPRGNGAQRSPHHPPAPPPVTDHCGVLGGDNACFDCAGQALPRSNAYCTICPLPGCAAQPSDIIGDAHRTVSGHLSCAPGSFLQFPTPGPNLLDKCGTCDDDAANDCVPNCRGRTDGAGYPVSPPGLLPGVQDPFVDLCNVCGGNSSSCTDCRGEPNGLASLDECGQCDENPSNDCVQDCAGVWGLAPSATDPLQDACGICQGDGSSCLDCKGVPNGRNTEDDCGICNDDHSDDCAQDCRGNRVPPSRAAVFDSCGICGGNNTSCMDCLGNHSAVSCWRRIAPAHTNQSETGVTEVMVGSAVQSRDGYWRCPNVTSSTGGSGGPLIVRYAQAGAARRDHCGICGKRGQLATLRP
jgi:hypothetical protein